MGAPRPRGPPPPPGEESRELEECGAGPKIPQALEKILQLKEIRQEELVTVPGLSAEDEMELELRAPAGVSASEAEDDGGLSKKERTRKRRNRKKKKRGPRAAPGAPREAAGAEAEAEAVEVEYVAEEPDAYEPQFVFFKKIFEAFRLTDEVRKDREREPERPERPEGAAAARRKGPLDGPRGDDSDDDEQDKKAEVPKLSKKKLRRLNRFTVAELKQLVARPDVVEMHDVTAQDPKLLVHLKATRNSVPVPRHWCFKRKYLQGKRGIEKPPFELPDFIKRTGIQEMREALQEKEEQKTLKSKMREKVRPKMGKIDIDYQKLHDAFFKWQSKPKLTIHGDLYYEGKEFETRLKEKKPGDLSDELRIALGMPVGPSAHKVPPPWLIAMQRYGPPPSYPNLKIPGLNSPIPEGCAFGYHAGGWGKPPVDETGKPLYGDVFGTNGGDFQAKAEEEEIDRTPWGELEPSDEESSEEEEEEESDEEGAAAAPRGLFAALPPPKAPAGPPSPGPAPEGGEERAAAPDAPRGPLGLPRPRKRTAEPVRIPVPALRGADSDSEEDEPAKKRSTFQGRGEGSGLSALLPQPKNLTVKESNRLLLPYAFSRKAAEAASEAKPAKAPSSSSKPRAPAKPAVATTPSPSAIKAAAKSAALQVTKQVTQEENDSDEEVEPENYFSLSDRSEPGTVGAETYVYSGTVVAEEPPPGTEPEPQGQDAAANAPLEFRTAAGSGGPQPSWVPSPGEDYGAQPYNQFYADAGVTGAYYQDYYGGGYYQEVDAAQAPPQDMSTDSSFLDDEAFKRLQGKRNRGREEINFVDIKGDDQLSGAQQWLTKSLTEEKTMKSFSKRKGDQPTGQQRRKHQITYLIHQAKERELELKNTWSENKLSRRQTQAKYGF